MWTGPWPIQLCPLALPQGVAQLQVHCLGLGFGGQGWQEQGASPVSLYCYRASNTELRTGAGDWEVTPLGQ